ncbi:uncharacterized protein F4807DRAFT_456293 [Annulohypoxylon truncatum]|uniref:uncharacterized protein n=1 Tax=Annulohypoxylon truncatum TaxID=327061 RepID=UPI00200727BB|nr:uncharacterized protein F4807DRAFT_456293 [Annulohypoxylon truncatum]KAI1213746.1 hypothetical protein F4807DRAFT_456293 [Annulohypoxylon truncatum]
MDGYNQVPYFQPGATLPANDDYAGDEMSTLASDTTYGFQPMAIAPPLPVAPLQELGEGRVGFTTHPLHARFPGLACTDCSKTFETNNGLRKHGEQQGHSPYGCICGAKYTRLDALNRHITDKSPNAPKYPCEYCYDRQGDNGFARRDHLIQHLKNFHRIVTADKLLQRNPVESRTAPVTGSAWTSTAANADLVFSTPITPNYSGMGFGYSAWGSTGLFNPGRYQATMDPSNIEDYPSGIQQNQDPMMQQFQQTDMSGFM